MNSAYLHIVTNHMPIVGVAVHSTLNQLIKLEKFAGWEGGQAQRAPAPA